MKKCSPVQSREVRYMLIQYVLCDIVYLAERIGKSLKGRSRRAFFSVDGFLVCLLLPMPEIDESEQYYAKIL